jgi:phosphatidate cytidylyltransferase
MFPFLSSGSQISVAMTALYGLLGVTSLLVRRRASPSGMLRDQVDAWWRIFPIVTIALLLYPVGPVLLAVLICLLAARELAPYSGEPVLHFHLRAATLASVVALLYWLAPIALPVLVLVAVVHFRLSPTPRRLIWLLLLVTAIAAWTLVQFARLPYGHAANLSWLFYLFIVTALNDIGQFVAGSLFGNRKIAPTISPNKTWQGLAGGIVVSLLVTLILGSYLQLAEPLQLAAIALLLALGGFAGDLLFSAAKRYLGIKDFSQLIPGHGGILDRVDSLVVTAPLLVCLLRTVE